MDYTIPLFELNYDEQEETAVIDTLRSRWISMGPKTAEFEDIFSSMINAKYSVAVANCTAALHLSMKILGIGEGDEVICPSLTFVATVNAIRYVNATPIFCDVKSCTDLNIDPEMIEKLVTRKTKAIIVMHYGGFPCDMWPIMEIARTHKLRVIEDACHGPLSEYAAQKLGTIGDIGCFSFFSNKNISTAEGGILITNNKELADNARLLRSHGMSSLSYDRAKGHATGYDVVDLGYNYRIDDIRASIGIVQLNKLKEDLRERAIVRKQYIEMLSECNDIYIPFKNNTGFVSNYIFPIVLRASNANKRHSVRERLNQRGIQTSVHYPAVHRFAIYRQHTVSLPITEYITDNEITLPLYSHLSRDQIEFVAESVSEAVSDS